MIIGPFMFEKWYVAFCWRGYERNLGLCRPDSLVGFNRIRGTKQWSGHIGPFWTRTWR